MKTTRFAIVITFFCAGPAMASNTGFKLNYTLRWIPGYANTNWVSIPYHTTLERSSELCREIDEQAGFTVVASVQRFDVPTNSIKTNPCSQLGHMNFALRPGEGYAVVPMADNVRWHPSHY
jgi:hypothetical protein